MASLIIAADLCPIEGNQPHFVRGDAPGLFHDLLPEFAAADLVIANLECPMIERPSPIAKTGPTFGEPAACLNGITAAGIDVLCLANNHILDHGVPGLTHTLEACARAGLATVGAGLTPADARRILVRQVGSWRVGILAMAEHEFSVTRHGSPGANPLDLMNFVRGVRDQRDQFDYLIVLLHGSAEFHAPTPRLQQTCRFMIELGADAVIVQHPHILGGCEEYQGGHIVYGQGALIMDEAIYRDRPSFHEGFLVKLTIPAAVFPAPPWEAGQGEVPSSRSPGRSQSEPQPSTLNPQPLFELIPFIQSAPPPGARKLYEEREQQFRQTLAQRSAAIQDPAFVEAEWVKFCQDHQRGYLSAVLGHNRVLRKLDFGGWLSRFIHSPRALLGTRNCVLCETHREALETIFTRLMK